MNDERKELIEVGDFELSPVDLVTIAGAYLRGESEAQIGERLGIVVADLVELLQHPEVFDKAVEARQEVLRLMLYGPVAENLLRIATSGSDKRSAIAAAKELRELSNAGRPAPSGPDAPGTAQPPPLTLIFQNGGYDRIVRSIADTERQKGQTLELQENNSGWSLPDEQPENVE